jgi:hypothetical protein
MIKISTIKQYEVIFMIIIYIFDSQKINIKRISLTGTILLKRIYFHSSVVIQQINKQFVFFELDELNIELNLVFVQFLLAFEVSNQDYNKFH